MSKTLISLVSEQTIPNVELIKEFKNDIQRLMFITTNRMEKGGQTEWIIEAAGADNIPAERIEVNPFDPNDIENKLRNHSFGETDEFIVNITGGTKLMSLIVNSVFRDLGARIFYVTGQNKEYLKIFPLIGKNRFELQEKITLDEYLTAYGLEINKPDQNCPYNQNYVEQFYQKYKTATQTLFESIKSLQKFRNKKSLKVDDSNLQGLLDYFELPREDPEKLTKSEIQFLTGEWFEWLVYNRVKNDLSLENTDIGLGYQIKKEGIPNEMDVMFVYKNKLYTIECKTGITVKEVTPDGKEKKRNLLSEIIYKSDSLQKKLGLFVKTSVFTLSQLYDQNTESPLPNMKNHLERAAQYRINVIGRKEIDSGKSIQELLNIK